MSLDDIEEIERFVDSLFARIEGVTDQPETVTFYAPDGTSRRLPVIEKLCPRCAHIRAHAVDGRITHCLTCGEGTDEGAQP